MSEEANGDEGEPQGGERRDIPRPLIESDVVFMYDVPDPETYRAYGANVLAWGGELNAEQVARLRALGVQTAGSMWCLTAGSYALSRRPELTEAVVRDITGEPIEVPWLPEGRAKGTPAWWGCFRHPAFRAHLDAAACAAVAGGADGLHVDDHLGTAHPVIEYGGCFCDFCMTAFREHLQGAGAAAAGRAQVMVDDAFNYRELVRSRVSSRDEYIRSQRGLPLHRAFVDFQLAGAAAVVAGLHRVATASCGRRLTLSANTALPQPPHLVVAPRLDRMVGEVDWSAASGVAHTGNAVVACRLADACGKPLACTATGRDWALIKARGATALVQYWIAQSCACGHRLMAPARAWCYTPGIGSDFYYGPTAAYAPWYQFVRRQSEALDGYRPAGAETLVLYNPPRDFHGDGRILALMQRLAAANVAFDVALLPNSWCAAAGVDIARMCRRYRRVVLDSRPDVAEPEVGAHLAEEVLTGHAGAVSLPEDDTEAGALLGKLRSQQWEVGDDRVWVFPRAKAGAPPVIHLLNRAYDAVGQQFAPRRGVSLVLHGPLAASVGESARLLRPEAEALTLPIVRVGASVRVCIPELPLWGVLVAGNAGATQ